MTAKQKVADQANGISYGCHVDLDEGEAPDGCVKDDGDDWACMYARRHRTREGCRWWRRIGDTL